MKNTYFTSYFPLIAILLYSMSFGIFTEMKLVKKLKDLGIYPGMLEFFSESGIKLALFFLMSLVFFMLLAALKVIAETMIELSFLFFSKDEIGENLKSIRTGSAFYLISGMLSLLTVHDMKGIIGMFLITTFIYFIFFVYKVSASLTGPGLIGLVFFHVMFWSTFTLGVIYLCVKLYNSMIESLPV
jgi:Family of unknown function (DUF5366)